MKIDSVSAWQIYDSRGNPTVEAEVRLEDGVRGHGIAPSGASTGQFEALELRDGDPRHFRGKSVFQCIASIQGEISHGLRGRNVFEQRQIDELLIQLDGTPNKSRLGTNALLPVSMAVAQAAAASQRKPLYARLGEGKGTLLPVPEIQMIGGGAHANWRTDVQDYLLIAVGAQNFAEAMEITHNVYHATGDLMKSKGKYFGVAEEGGYWPEFDNNEQPLAVLAEAIERAGYTLGKEAAIALDFAASDLFDQGTGRYRFKLESREFTSDEFAGLVEDWCQRFSIVSVEDPLADTDWAGWRKLKQSIGADVQLVGDDLFTTSVDRIKSGINRNVANAVLIKLNQVGTVSETLEAIRLTQQAGWQPIISARSGETEDAFISHLAVATNAGQIKVGSFARSERMVKWNEIIRIERDLAGAARFRGWPTTQFRSRH